MKILIIQRLQNGWVAGDMPYRVIDQFACTTTTEPGRTSFVFNKIEDLQAALPMLLAEPAEPAKAGTPNKTL